MIRPRGFALASIVLMALVVLVVAFTAAAIGTYHLQLAQTEVNEETAQYLADGLVQSVEAQLAHDPTFGTTTTTVYYPPGPPVNGNPYAVAVFSTSLPDSASTPWSTNNLAGGNGTGWGGAAVSQGSVRVVAIGYSGSIRRIVDATLEVPRFPYVIAGDGNVTLANAAVEGIVSTQQYYNSPPGRVPAIQPCSTTYPANVGVNGTLTLTGVTSVTGNIVSPRCPVLAGGSLQIGGTIKRGRVELPVLSYLYFRNHIWGPAATGTPAGGPPWGPATTPSPADAFGNVTLDDSHVFYVPGSLSVAGSLVLHDAELFVDGNLTVGTAPNPVGGMWGRGAVFVQGTTQIDGGADLSGAADVALVSEGKVCLKGLPGCVGCSSKNYFQGLLYTQGALTAAQITISGAVVQQGAAGGINLQSCVKFIGNSNALIQHFQTQPVDSQWAAAYCWPVGGGTTNTVAYCGKGYPVCACTTAPPKPPSLPCGFVPQKWLATNKICGGTCFSGPENTARTQLQTYLASCSCPKMLPCFALSSNDQILSGSWIGQNPPNLSVISLHYNAQLGQFVMCDPPLLLAQKCSNTVITYSQYLQYLAPCHISPDQIQQQISCILKAQTSYMTEANQLLQGMPPPAPLPYAIDLDLSHFLSESVPIHISSWKTR